MTGLVRDGLLLLIALGASLQVAHAQACVSATGCASVAFAETHTHALGELDMAITGRVPTGGALLASKFAMAGLDGRLSYQVQYTLDTGDIFSAPENRQAQLHTLAAEHREQRWGLRLGTLAGQPAVLEHRLSTRQRWTVDGLQHQREERTELRWQSERAELRLQLASPTTQRIDAVTGLRCDASASMTFRPQAKNAPSGHQRSLQLLAQHCQRPTTTASDPSPRGATAMMLSYRREDARGSDTLRFRQLSAPRQWEGGVGGSDLTYHFQWQHQRGLGVWRTTAHATLRHDSPSLAPGAAYGVASSRAPLLQWDADASLARELLVGTAFARLSSASAAPPALPASPAIRTDRLHLGVDLSRWLASVLPGAAPSLVMQWHGTLSSGGPDRATARDQSMDLKVAMHW